MRPASAIVASAVLLAMAAVASAQVRFTENFENPGPTQGGAHGPANLISQGWIFRNQSEAPGINVWRTGDSIEDGYGAQSGSRFLTTASSWDSGTRAVSVWAVLPPVSGQQAGDTVSVFARGWVEGTTRVQLWYSPSGGTGTGSGPEGTGDFSVLLAETGFGPHAWTPLSAPLPGAGRIAVRAYEPGVGDFVSPIISIDSLTVSAGVLDAPIPGPGETVTWTAAMSPVQVRSNATIPADATVIVEPGVTVNVQQQATLTIGAGGTLRLDGTPEQPVLFTAAAVFPPMIAISGGTLDADHAEFRGQVRPNARGAMLIADSTFTGPTGLIFGDLFIGSGFGRIERTTFNNSELTVSQYTLVLDDLTLNNTFSRFVRDYVFFRNITSNGRSVGFFHEEWAQPILVDDLTVTGVGDGAALHLAYANYFVGPNVEISGSQFPASIDSAGIVPGSRLPASGNQDNRIFVPGGDHSGALQWGDPGIPYLITAAYAQHGGSIFMHPGVTVHMAPGSGLRADPAEIRAMGTEERPIAFTQGTPGGRWFPLMLFHRIRHALIEGASTGGAWPSCCGWGFVDSSIVRDCQDFGLRGQVMVRKTLFQDNGIGAFTSFGDDLLGLTNPNAFEGNTVGVSDANNAAFNWWGSPTGPTTPTNPAGAGDAVASGVPYQPFLTERPDFADAPPVVDLEKHSAIMRPGQKVILTWRAHDDGQIVSQSVRMVADGDVVQGNLIEPIIVLADNLPGSQRSIEFTVPSVGVRWFGAGTVRVESVDDAGQVGWDDMSVYIERDEPGQLVITTPVGPVETAGQPIGAFCWDEQGINPLGGSVNAYLYLENSDYYIGLGGVTTYLNCLPLELDAPLVSTDRARLVLSLFTGGGVAQPEYYFGEPFAIRPDPRVGDAPPGITLTSPAQGASFPGGSIVPLAWTASDDQFVRSLKIQASTDGGRTWNTVVSDLPGDTTSYAWRLPPSTGIDDVRVKVIAIDRRFQDSSDQRAITVTITTGSGGGCAADWDSSGEVNSSDISAFLTAWLASVQQGNLLADFNADGRVNSADISAFLTAWLAAVQTGC